MSDEQKVSDKVEAPHFPGEIELYGDPGIASYDAKVPTFLKWTYFTLPIWGIITLFVFWNGSTGGWTDRGYWRELQIASNTTFPLKNHNLPTAEAGREDEEQLFND
jgi:hypothetical protein